MGVCEGVRVSVGTNDVVCEGVASWVDDLLAVWEALWVSVGVPLDEAEGVLLSVAVGVPDPVCV